MNGLVDMRICATSYYIPTVLNHLYQTVDLWLHRKITSDQIRKLKPVQSPLVCPYRTYVLKLRKHLYIELEVLSEYSVAS